jgi:hypothetical protein
MDFMGLDQLTEAKRKALAAEVLKLFRERKSVRQVQRTIFKKFNVRLDPRK